MMTFLVGFRTFDSHFGISKIDSERNMAGPEDRDVYLCAYWQSLIVWGGQIGGPPEVHVPFGNINANLSQSFLGKTDLFGNNL